MHHFKIISRGGGGHAPEHPYQRATCKFPSLKTILGPPPLPNPGYAPKKLY